MKFNKLSRRMFLQGTGATLSIPFLPSLITERAAAQALAPMKYIHMSMNNGFHRMTSTPLMGDTMPKYPMPAGTTQSSVPWIQKDADTKVQSLQEIVNYQGFVSHTFDARFNPYISKMILVSNAHAYVTANNHNSCVNTACSVGAGSVGNGAIWGPLDVYSYSVDFLMEEAMKRLSPTQLGALRINIAADNGGWDTFCFGVINGQPKRLPMMSTVDELRQKILGSLGNSVQPVESKNNRKSRIDSVLEDFNQLMNHRRISSLDKQRLSDAADLWRTIERSLFSMTGTTPSSPTCMSPSLPATPADWGARHRLALDMVTLALSCGLTRVASYAITQGGDNFDHQGEIHGMQHDPGYEINTPFFSQMMPWRSDKFLYLLNRLNSVADETGQPLLNSSLVAWAGEYGHQNHGMLGHNLMLVGGANGRLDTGWHVDAGGAPINRFHLTNMLAMGLGQSDIEKNGQPGFGEIGQLYNHGEGQADVALTQETNYHGTHGTVYDNSKLGYFAGAAQRRKPFPYLR